MDLLAIDLISFLITYSTADLQRSNTSKDLSAGTCFGANLSRGFLEFSNYTVDLCKHQVFLLLSHFQSLFQLFAVRRICFNSQALGNQEVTGIAVSNFYQFILTTQVVYVLN